MIKYNNRVFRPPAEGDSLIFQVACGCPHNTCRFCGMYKGVKYEVRPMPEVLAEIEEAGSEYSDEKRIFLADGDVMAFPFEHLKTILEKLNESFPNLARVSVYANGTSILDKSEEQLCELRNLKLNTVYLGLESGDQEVIDKVCKSENVDDMVKAVQVAQKCGLRASIMILLGLGGKDGSLQHAVKTAEAVNRMQPRLLAALRYLEVPNTKMFDGYQPVSEYEAVCELRTIIEYLDLKKTVFRANHSSNPVPLGGRFPQDKQNLLNDIDHMLEHGNLDKDGPGRTPMWL